MSTFVAGFFGRYWSCLGVIPVSIGNLGLITFTPLQPHTPQHIICPPHCHRQTSSIWFTHPADWVQQFTPSIDFQISAIRMQFHWDYSLSMWSSCGANGSDDSNPPQLIRLINRILNTVNCVDLIYCIVYTFRWCLSTFFYPKKSTLFTVCFLQYEEMKWKRNNKNIYTLLYCYYTHIEIKVKTFYHFFW